MTDATPLQMAAEGGHAEVVKALVRAGASVTDENKGKRLYRIYAFEIFLTCSYLHFKFKLEKLTLKSFSLMFDCSQ